MHIALESQKRYDCMGKAFKKAGKRPQILKNSQRIYCRDVFQWDVDGNVMLGCVASVVAHLCVNHPICI